MLDGKLGACCCAKYFSADQIKIRRVLELWTGEVQQCFGGET